MFDIQTLDWCSDHVALPVVNGKKILLVPKAIVRWNTSLVAREYYNNYVLNFIQAREWRHPAIGLVNVIKGERRKPTKKELKKRFPCTKDFLLEFSEKNPEVLERYKNYKSSIDSVTNLELDEKFNERPFSEALIEQLNSIPPGNDAAHKYHHFMKGVLTFLFYPALTHPRIEAEINEGRKRIDIQFVNSDRNGFFSLFPIRTRKPAPEIIVECKNYVGELGNPEVDQIAMRFADHRGWLGLLICRSIKDSNSLMARCRDVARDRNGFIIPLEDKDIIGMLSLVASNQRDMLTGRLDILMSELSK